MNNKLLEENMDFLFFSALDKCGNADDAHDLTQETLLSALVFISKGGIADNIKSWLLSVMNRKYYDMLRKKYRRPVVYMDDISELMSENDISDDIIKEEDAESIRREVAYLSKLYREVTVSFYMNNKSVEQIAEELNIPVGTVKSRLSKSREKIRKGIYNMDKYSDLSYEPKRLHIANSGMWGMNFEPGSLVNNDLLTQNILIAAYDEPLTDEEISKKIGIPTAYIEEKTKMLVYNELMCKTGNKVYTDFVIYPPEEQFKYIPAQKQFASEKFEYFWNPINEGLEKIRQTEAYSKLSLKQKRVLEYFIIIKCLDYEHSGEKIYARQVFKDRPNGGIWIAFGHIKSDLAEKPENQGYSYSGERHCWFDNGYLTAKSLVSHIYTTPLENNTQAALKYRYMGEENLTQLLYIINEDIPIHESGFDTSFLENIPSLINKGILEKANDKLQVTIPIIPKNKYAEIDAITGNTINNLSNNITDIMIDYLKGKNVPLPKHLTSVPGQKQYMCATINLLMAVIYKAKEMGYIIKDDNDSLPAMVLITEK